ncbi:hypothetical protein FLJC2902T_32150 [Flavobacterium limnosediminis JC2902]|uniref:Uncharacterized protein n=1 Tax=Flavobacterium limnosediminis JC2902 TaxID=1341181 RepID=V6SBU7_9FLAO|nr:hypothetical protein FLJC2902T_32150 [Flavobacterium limnosediminis JC2902]
MLTDGKQRSPATNSGFMKWLGSVFISNGQCLHFFLRKRLFSFSLLGIFVNISNKIPPLHKAGGTLTVILPQNCENQNLL